MEYTSVIDGVKYVLEADNSKEAANLIGITSGYPDSLEVVSALDVATGLYNPMTFKLAVNKKGNKYYKRDQK